ncbi:hypothetical protein BF49_4649 [Bradyrhizobium sp.]|uniref:hypothetical protein n=1 Tax=Bradyrhizobium sp. TaxID=376 RepID=UPI0007C1A41F|nr:hypothetical protein [Bradyrhizobium sp.]CUT13569.1 hypothetical protein BF49_4649 [Bradyrhizobium sp.]
MTKHDIGIREARYLRDGVLVMSSDNVELEPERAECEEVLSEFVDWFVASQKQANAVP